MFALLSKYAFELDDVSLAKDLANKALETSSSSGWQRYYLAALAQRPGRVYGQFERGRLPVRQLADG